MAKGSSNQLPFFSIYFLFLLSISNALSFSSEASPLGDFKKREIQREEERQILRFSHRALLNDLQYKTTEFDSIDPPTTTFPITNPVTTPTFNPVTTPALNVPPASQVPAVVTIPSTNPVPPATVTIPPATPITVPNTNPVNSPIPVTNPVTTPSTIPVVTAPPVNPVTTPAAPVGGTGTVPVTNPSTTPTPAVAGQSWCIVKNGASQTAVQAALDYACGIGGADCASIQQGANCYNPNSLQNHASYAFNSYYQKNPVPTSCDFGGAAAITSQNPSSGSCIYPSSASSASSSSSPTVTTPTPTTIPTPTTSSSSGSSPVGVIPGAITPPSVLNSSSGFPDSGTTTGFGATPPLMNSAPSSASAALRPLIGYLVVVASITMGRSILHM